MTPEQLAELMLTQSTRNMRAISAIESHPVSLLASLRSTARMLERVMASEGKVFELEMAAALERKLNKVADECESPTERAS